MTQVRAPLAASRQCAEELPLTPPQRGFLDPAWIPLLGGGCCNVAVTLSVDRSVPVGMIQRAIDSLVSRHPALTVRFTLGDGDPTQRFVNDAPVIVRTVDLTERGPDGERLCEVVGQEDARTPFDLSSGPLCRFLAVRHAGGVSVHGTFHHAIFDGRSADIVRAELRDLIDQLCAGREPELGAIPAYCSVVREVVTRGEGHEEYWRHARAALPTTLNLPVRDRQPATTVRFATVPLALDAASWDRLRQTCTSLRVSPFMAGFAAVVGVIASFDETPRIGVSHMAHGRPSDAHMDVVGCFATAIFTLVAVDDDPTLGELLRRVRTAVLTTALKHPCAYEHSPMASDVPGLNWTTLVAQDPDPETAAADGAAGSRRPPAEASEAMAITVPSPSTGATLVFRVTEHANALAGALAFDVGRMLTADALRIARAFEQFLVKLPDQLDTRLSGVARAEAA